MAGVAKGAAGWVVVGAGAEEAVDTKTAPPLEDVQLNAEKMSVL